MKLLICCSIGYNLSPIVSPILKIWEALFSQAKSQGMGSFRIASRWCHHLETISHAVSKLQLCSLKMLCKGVHTSLLLQSQAVQSAYACLGMYSHRGGRKTCLGSEHAVFVLVPHLGGCPSEGLKLKFLWRKLSWMRISPECLGHSLFPGMGTAHSRSFWVMLCRDESL